MNDSTQPVASLQRGIIHAQTSLATVKHIEDNEQFLAACEISKSISQLRKAVDETFNPIIAAANKTHKEALDQKKKFSLPLELGQREIDFKINTYRQRQEQKRREEERQLQEQARKDAEERALHEAEELARQGEHEHAQAVIEEAIAAPAPVVSIAPSVPKVQGIAARPVWRWKIVDETKIPREYLTVDEIKISGVVRALKNKANIPGIQVYEESTTIHR